MGRSCFFCLLILSVIHPEIATGQNDCIGRSCSKHGPSIRFPFRLKDKQPNHCGYPGFDLSCTENNHTLLELPNSVNLYVEKIDYKSRVIHTYDPLKCLPTSLRNLSLSGSVFKFPFGQNSNILNCTLFNCTSLDLRSSYYGFEVPCLGSSGRHVYALRSGIPMGSMTFSSCTKMYDIFNVPSDILHTNNVLFDWTTPSCTACEAAGMKCRLERNSMVATECYGKIKPSKGGKTPIWVSVSVLGSFLLLVVMIVLCLIYRAHKKDKENQAKIEKFLEDYRALKPTRYSYADIKRITNNFKDKLGQGGYGTVFKGKLSNEILVAVKMLNSSTGDGEEFINEVGTMGQIHHVNVVRMVGYCADGFRRALVYDFFPNESLDKFIFSTNGSSHVLGWEKLQEIAFGIAKGIEYLHQGCEQRILHFDIKPHNVLLDNNFNPKISDFGLAKLCSKDKSAVSMTGARGTMGYIAPEVLSRKNVSYKSDVYSYGMLLLEMVGGRKNIDVTVDKTSQVYFPEWIYNRLEQGQDLGIKIEEVGDSKIAKKLTMVGLWCIQWYPIDRPSMKIVVQMLEGEGDNLPKPPNPFASTGNKTTNGSVPGRQLHPELEVISEAE